MQYTPYTPETYPNRLDPLEALKRVRIYTVEKALLGMAEAMGHIGINTKNYEQYIPHTSFNSTAPHTTEQPKVAMPEITLSDEPATTNGNPEGSTSIDYLERLARDLASDTADMFLDPETN